MKKYVTIAFTLILLCFCLCGCRQGGQPDMGCYRKIANYASNHLNLMMQIKDSLSDIKPRNNELTVCIEQGALGALIERHYSSDSKEPATLENEQIANLYSDGIVDCIYIYRNCIVFGCSQYGDRESSYGVVYCPSGSITDYYNYPSNYAYAPYKNGMLGVGKPDDHVFFYVDLGNSFFYFEDRC